MFGLLHLANEGATIISTINLSLLGILFALSYVFTGDLAWPLGLLLGWNVCQNNLLGFANSGKPSEVSLFNFHLQGTELWTGGTFGIEGSVVTSLMLTLVLTTYLRWQYVKEGGFQFKIRLAGNKKERA